VLYEQLRDKWHARERAAPIHPAMTFAAEGLVLGAGTILVPAEGIRRLKSLRGQEQRILALLSAAHGKAVWRMLDFLRLSTSDRLHAASSSLTRR
jgi:hypothetical protein